jgi:hypothetical protein
MLDWSCDSDFESQNILKYKYFALLIMPKGSDIIFVENQSLINT